MSASGARLVVSFEPAGPKAIPADDETPPAVRGLSAFIKPITIEEAIEELGIGRTQWVLLLICGLTFCSDAAELTFLSYVTEVLRCQWGLTKDQESCITAAVFVGMILGAPVWGCIADKLGRRMAFLMSSAVICVFGFATALAQGFVSLMLVRAVVGFGVAGVPVGFDILAEALPSSGRGAFLLYIEFFWTLGSIYVNVIAWLTLETAGWQVFTALAAVPTLVSWVAGYLRLPESPRWLVDEGREGEALVIVNQWAQANGRAEQFEELEKAHIQHVGMVDLFTRSELRAPTLLMAVVWFAFGVAYYGVVMLLPRIFDDTSGSEADSGSCRVDFNFQDLAISSIFEVLGVIFTLMMIDRLGRTWTQGIFYALGAAFIFLLGFRHLDIKLLTAVASLGRLAEMAASSATWVHTPELFPTTVRGEAHALLNLMSKVGAVAAQFLISDMFSQVAAGTMMALTSLAAGIAALFLTETAGVHLGAMSIPALSAFGGSMDGDQLSDSDVSSEGDTRESAKGKGWFS